MSRDGDVALDGQAMDALAKERRAVALGEALQGDDGGWTKHTPWHWQRQVAGKLLDYWPSKRKWQWGGKVISGSDQDLSRFIVKRVREVAERGGQGGE